MDERPSGWYDDPEQPSRLRYWDGTTWTERTHDKAPMPAPQPPRPPVSRLRPSREAEPTHGHGGRDEEADVGARAASPSNALPSQSSPRPWSAPEETDRRGAASGRHRPEPGNEATRASYGRRVLGFVLDVVIVFVVFTILLTAAMPFLGDALRVAESYGQAWLAAAQRGQTPPQPPAEVEAMSAGLYMILAALLVLYDVVLVRFVGGTIGHRVAGVRVTESEGGGVPTPGRLLLRALVKYSMFVFSAWTATVLLGYVFSVVNFTWPLMDSRRRTLHDKWSDTRVVRHR